MVRVLSIVCITICVFFQDTMGSISGLPWKQIQQWRETNETGNIRPQSSVRSMLNLYSMIECATNCDPWNLKNYGNYCGFGGSGTPINKIDRCCQQHDECYEENSLKYECSITSIYLTSYEWSCNYSYPCCHGPDTCGIWTCVCDRKFMECLNDAGCP